MYYKDLEVYKKSIELVKEIYRISLQFPNDEQFGLVSQIKRAVISIPSNKAEELLKQVNALLLGFKKYVDKSKL